ITGKDLAAQGIDLSYSSSELQNHYDFGFIVAPTRMQEVARNLNTLRQDLPSGLKGLRFSAYLSASDKAVGEARLSVLPDLVADARQRADVLARLSGLSLGPVESITDTATLAIRTTSARKLLYIPLASRLRLGANKTVC